MADTKAKKALTEAEQRQTIILVELLPVQGKTERFKKIDISKMVDGRIVDGVLYSSSYVKNEQGKIRSSEAKGYIPYSQVKFLKNRISKILDAVFVNTKQRASVGDLINAEIDEELRRHDSHMAQATTALYRQLHGDQDASESNMEFSPEEVTFLSL